MECRKIFVNHISGEGLISSIYKEPLQSNQQKTKKSIKTGHRTWIDISPKKRESTLWVNLVEKFSHFGDLLLLLLFPLQDRLQIPLGQGLINKRVFLSVCSAHSFRSFICTCTSKRCTSLYISYPSPSSKPLVPVTQCPLAGWWRPGKILCCPGSASVFGRCYVTGSQRWTLLTVSAPPPAAGHFPSSSPGHLFCSHQGIEYFALFLFQSSNGFFNCGLKAIEFGTLITEAGAFWSVGEIGKKGATSSSPEGLHCRKGLPICLSHEHPMENRMQGFLNNPSVCSSPHSIHTLIPANIQRLEFIKLCSWSFLTPLHEIQYVLQWNQGLLHSIPLQKHQSFLIDCWPWDLSSRRVQEKLWICQSSAFLFLSCKSRKGLFSAFCTPKWKTEVSTLLFVITEFLSF